MAEFQVRVRAKTLLERLHDMLERNPENCDVTFCVGPDQKIVRAVKIILKAASPVFEREFGENWETGLNNDGEPGKGILLPDLDGNSFELFIKLTTLDTWSLTTLKHLDLLQDELLNLITLCRHFEMTEGFKNLTEIFVSFFRSFYKYQHCEGFLHLSRENLKTILASEEIPLGEFDVFQAACRWAEAQCAQQNIEISNKNILKVLGDCVHEIRFPLMTNSRFTKARKMHDILTPEESLQIFDFIGLNNLEKLNFDKSSMKFKTEPRKHFLGECKRLSLTNEIRIANVDNPPFQCEGEEVQHCFIPNQRIAIHGFSFFGPIDKNAEYDVTCRIYDCEHEKYMYEMNTKILAEKGKEFQWMFDQLVILEPREFTWGKHYIIYFSLKGPPTSSISRKHGHDSLLEEGGTEFLLSWHSNQLTEILFKNL